MALHYMPCVENYHFNNYNVLKKLLLKTYKAVIC